MSKNSFQFKQFTIHQEDATLKVCTDSCLFGSWIASAEENFEKVLDIGSGTGLLSLMYAQKNASSLVSAIEIDEHSAELTKNNFSASPWKDRLSSYHTSLQEYSLLIKEKYDCIICNPPFFENNLNSEVHRKNLAKHQAGITKEDLLEGIKILLKEEGTLYILLPPFEARELVILAQKREIYLNDCVSVLNLKGQHPFRVMMKFSSFKKDIEESEMIIYKEEKVYSSEFTNLLKPYYLYL